jgi:hypothetical protein
MGDVTSAPTLPVEGSIAQIGALSVIDFADMGLRPQQHDNAGWSIEYQNQFDEQQLAEPPSRG